MKTVNRSTNYNKLIMPFKSEKQKNYFFWKANDLKKKNDPSAKKWEKLAHEFASHTNFKTLKEEETNQNHIPVISHTSVGNLVKQPLFNEAKNGSIRFAKKLIELICKPDIIDQIITNYPTAHLVPLRKQGQNINNIPYAYALLLKSKNKSFYIDEIYQTNKVKKRGLKAIDRMANETTFVGDIVKGQKYIIIDDVIATGSTIKSLVNYIQERGGVVVLITTVANASNINTGSGNKNFNQTPEMLKLLDLKIGIENVNNLFKKLDIKSEVSKLTNTQIKVLLMYKTIDNIEKVLTSNKGKTLNESFKMILNESFIKDKLKKLKSTYTGQENLDSYLTVYQVIKNYLPNRKEADINNINKGEELITIVQNFYNLKVNDGSRFFEKNEKIFDLYNRLIVKHDDSNKNVGISLEKPKDTDIVYEDNNLLVVKGLGRSRCINYGRGQSWCISKDGVNYYNTYRMNHNATIYFCLQKNLSKNDPEEKFVILVYPHAGGYLYAIADKTNAGNRHGGPNLATSWENIESQLPILKGKRELFKPLIISDDEKIFNDINAISGSLIDFYDEYFKGKKIDNEEIRFSDYLIEYVRRNKLTQEQTLDIFERDKIGSETLIESGYFIKYPFKMLMRDFFMKIPDVYKRRIATVLYQNHQFFDACTYIISYLKDEFKKDINRLFLSMLSKISYIKEIDENTRLEYFQKYFNGRNEDNMNLSFLNELANYIPLKYLRKIQSEKNQGVIILGLESNKLKSYLMLKQNYKFFNDKVIINNETGTFIILDNPKNDGLIYDLEDQNVYNVEQSYELYYDEFRDQPVDLLKQTLNLEELENLYKICSTKIKLDDLEKVKEEYKNLSIKETLEEFTDGSISSIAEKIFNYEVDLHIETDKQSIEYVMDEIVERHILDHLIETNKTSQKFLDEKQEEIDNDFLGFIEENFTDTYYEIESAYRNASENTWYRDAYETIEQETNKIDLSTYIIYKLTGFKLELDEIEEPYNGWDISPSSKDFFEQIKELI